MTLGSDIVDRVERERISHEDDNVLARAYALKDRFSHIWTITDRVRKDENRLLKQAKGKRVLDYGCGRGEFALQLLEIGAIVEGIDISSAYVKTCEEVCKEHGYPASSWSFQVMDAHQLTFEDNSFDYVVGNGILHHLDFDNAMSEIQRVLAPGGRAIFQEPLSGNPLLGLLRLMTPKARTEDERPFDKRDLQKIAANWDVQSTYYGLLSGPVAMATSIIARPWPNNFLLRSATWLENKLSTNGIFHSWNQYVLFNLVKR